MLLTRLKIATAVLAVILAAGTGMGGLLYGLAASEPAAARNGPEPAAQTPSRTPAEETVRVTEPDAEPVKQAAGARENAKPDPEAVTKELAKFQGTWVAAVGGEFRGQKYSEEEIRQAQHSLVISGDELTWRTALGVILVGKIAIDPTKQPKQLDIVFTRDGQPATDKCIYELKDDTLKYCYSEGTRPTEFKTTADDNLMLYVFKREGR